MREKVLVKLVLAVVVALLFYSCDQSRLFDSYRKIQDSSWHKDSTVVFSFPVTDTIHNHNLFIQVRNKTSYKYSNLWLFIEITQPGGKVNRDTFEIGLAEPSGRWLGEGMGGIKTVQAIYQRNVYFPVSGEYTISLQHGMRENILPGVHDIGIRVEKITGSE